MCWQVGVSSRLRAIVCELLVSLSATVRFVLLSLCATRQMRSITFDCVDDIFRPKTTRLDFKRKRLILGVVEDGQEVAAS